METHEGGCACGAVRYRVKNAPFRTSACHCRACQRRTGSAFGVGIYFKDGDFELLRGTVRCYEFNSDESGRWLRMEFCVNCGTTVSWTAEAFPGGRGVAGGTFDDTGWLNIDRHVWTRSAHHWMAFPPGVERLEKSSVK
jgi:hypothetical protein